MTKAAVKILSDNDIRLKMGREARKRSKIFDVNVIVPQYMDYYKTVLNI
jgi:glycosyltransferase involved in cell wall biosynthesis